MAKTYQPLFRGEADAKAAQAGVGRLNQFGWYNLLYAAAAGQLAQVEYIKSMNVHTVFQFLTRQREEQRFAQRLQKAFTDEVKATRRK